jgi:hypothetical protein
MMVSSEDAGLSLNEESSDCIFKVRHYRVAEMPWLMGNWG